MDAPNGKPKFEDAFVRLRSKTNGEWFVHPDLRPRLVADANAQGTNMTEVAVKILCARYRVPYASPARRTDPRPDDDKIVLRLPRELDEALRREHGKHAMDGLRATLCDHYGLAVPVREPRTRQRRAA